MKSGRCLGVRRRSRQAGVMFLGLLICVALFGLGMVGIAKIAASVDRADKERELILIGHQFRDAINSYYTSGPTVGAYPPTLEDLLLDKRLPTVKRHLRRIYADPITGKNTWGFVKGPAGGIMGVYSLSEREPQKRSNFELQDAEIQQFVENKLKNIASNLNNSPSSPIAATGPAQSTALSGIQSLNNSSLNLTSQIAITKSIDGEAPETISYSYKDWKFVYRPIALSPIGNISTTGLVQQ